MPVPIRKTEAATVVDAALDWHGGDSRATIETLLMDCAHLRAQLDTASRCLSRGLTRGWLPELDRNPGVETPSESSET
ncbi:hypothetical protein [Rhizobium johnstonii]|uniref:hypothetical protein n=1 Tax=Rhizobium johnstonii TaxID=3019933 RepID=UPI002DDD49D5|nr:hypothetical protein U8P72_11525 [Rhizobium johnstonii]